MIGSTFESFLEELQQSNWDPEATSKNHRNHKSLYQWSTDQNAQEHQLGVCQFRSNCMLLWFTEAL